MKEFRKYYYLFFYKLLQTTNYIDKLGRVREFKLNENIYNGAAGILSGIIILYAYTIIYMIEVIASKYLFPDNDIILLGIVVLIVTVAIGAIWKPDKNAKWIEYTTEFKSYPPKKHRKINLIVLLIVIGGITLFTIALKIWEAQAQAGAISF